MMSEPHPHSESITQCQKNVFKTRSSLQSPVKCSLAQPEDKKLSISQAYRTNSPDFNENLSDSSISSHDEIIIPTCYKKMPTQLNMESDTADKKIKPPITKKQVSKKKEDIQSKSTATNAVHSDQSSKGKTSNHQLMKNKMSTISLSNAKTSNLQQPSLVNIKNVASVKRLKNTSRSGFLLMDILKTSNQTPMTQNTNKKMRKSCNEPKLSNSKVLNDPKLSAQLTKNVSQSEGQIERLEKINSCELVQGASTSNRSSSSSNGSSDPVGYYKSSETISRGTFQSSKLSTGGNEPKGTLLKLCTAVEKLTNKDPPLCNKKAPTTHFPMIMKILTFKVIWLKEQKIMNSPPPVFLEEAEKIPLYFNSFEQYVKIFYPMLMLETWETMYLASEEMESKEDYKNEHKFNFLIHTSETLPTEPLVTKCYCELSKNKKMSSDLTGHLLILKFSKNDSSSVLGFVCSPWLEIHKNEQSASWNKVNEPWVKNAEFIRCSVLIRTRPHLSLNADEIMEGSVLCDITRYLNLFDALQCFKSSPLCSAILKPTLRSCRINYSSSSRPSEAAVEGMKQELLRPEPKIMLLQGFPGTGKSQVIVRLIEELFLNQVSGLRILVAAPTDVVADEIGSRLIDVNERSSWRDRSINFIRFGAQDQISAKMKPFTLDVMYTQRFDVADVQKYKMNTITRQYHKFQVFLTTLGWCSKDSELKTILKINSFSCCIIDNATQSTELEILQGLIFGITKLIMIGNPQQLPVTVVSPKAVSFGYDQSMFKRFFDAFKNDFNATISTLTEQFRMHSEISRFPSNYMFGGNMSTAADIYLRYEGFPVVPYIFYNVEENPISSNLPISGVINMCTQLLSLAPTSSIGIIVPDQNQRLQYEKWIGFLSDEFKICIDVNMVEGFQGRERDVIILSCHTFEKVPSFMTCLKRLIVALTRAKKCLIICGCDSSLNQQTCGSSYEYWIYLMQDAAARHLYHRVKSFTKMCLLLKPQL